jgi:hypothetical protein
MHGWQAGWIDKIRVMWVVKHIRMKFFFNRCQFFLKNQHPYSFYRYQFY